jgi:hypothetical protein
VQVENDLPLTAQEPKANNVARQQRDHQRRPVMHEWPVSLTDDRFKEWRHIPGSAAGLSSLPQAEYADRHLDEERHADAQHYCRSNHPIDNRDDGRKCCGSSHIPALNQARLALPQAPQTRRATLFSGVASNRNSLEIRGSGRRNKDRFNSHCREQSGVGFSSMGPLPRRPWSAFQARKVLKQHSLTIVRIIRKVAILVELSSLVKMRPWPVFIVWLSP